MNSKSCLDHIFKDKELKNACEFMCNGKSVAASVVMFPPPPLKSCEELLNKS